MIFVLFCMVLIMPSEEYETVNYDIPNMRDYYTHIKGDGEDKVTLMVYMVGSDLESDGGAASEDIAEMTAANADNINITLQTGGAAAWENASISDGKTERHIIKNGELQNVANLGETQMTSPNTLTDFIKWSASNYPADRYELLLWNHGGGTALGFGYDEMYPDDMLSLSQIGNALSYSGIKFDIVGFDACLMGTIETAYMLEPYADYLVVQVEQYNLHVEYVPYTMNERETNKAPGTLSTAPGTELSEIHKKISDNYYYVNVVAGKIQLIKKLDDGIHTPAPDDDKTFEFNVEYTAPGGTATELKKIDLTVKKGEKISGEGTVVYETTSDLPRGTYVINESLNPEYKLKNIENSITSTISTSEGSQSVTKTTNCYNEISNPIADDSSITFTIGTNTEGNVIGKDENRNVTGLNETEIEKTTSKEGVVTAIKATTAAEGYATFTNEARLSSIHIKKVDADGKTPLEGAKFTLKKKGTEAEPQNITTNKNGEADFTGIAPGSYQITEVQSPKGYTLLANPIEVTLPYTASSTDVSTTDTPIKIGDTNYYYNITYTIKNNKLFNMPASGGRFKATLIGIAVMIMAAGCYILRHRRKRVI